MRRTGQSLRMIGLLIEMVGVLGVVRDRDGQSGPRLHIPGGPVVPVAWLAVVLGFVLWLVGRVLVAASRPPRRPDSRPVKPPPESME